ncbi:MAG: amidohydrolase [Spirochaetales bacterium]|nr:amidohydrolase [Spirochaetales bacterium]
MYEEQILDAIKSDRDYLVALRRYFHKHPELSRKEFGTARRIEEELDKLGLEHSRVGETGVYTEFKGELEGERTIVLRADIDALPVKEEHECEYRSEVEGVMHACGHDGHAASLLAAVKFLSTHRNLFGGTVRVTFQQAEEIGYGARLFVDGGYLDGADRTFGIHTESRMDVGTISLTPGPNNASVDYFRITVTGKGAHVSVPNRGVDALYIASQIVVSAQALVTRRTDPTDSLLIGIGKLEAGRAYNVVADLAVMEGTIRAISPKTRAQAKKELERLAESIAESFGGSVAFEWKDFTSPLINDREASIEAQKVARRLFGESAVITDRPYSLGGDDFAEYIIKVPGVYGFVGSGNDARPETRVAHHDCHFDIDEDCLVVAAAMDAAYAINFLNGTID